MPDDALSMFVLVLLLAALTYAPLAILWRCERKSTALGFAAIAMLIAIATAVAFVIVDDSPPCDDICERLYPLMFGAGAVTALDIMAWLLALVVAARRRLARP